MAAGIDRGAVRHAAGVDANVASGIDRGAVRHAAAVDVHSAAGIDGGPVRRAAAGDVHLIIGKTYAGRDDPAGNVKSHKYETLVLSRVGTSGDKFLSAFNLAHNQRSVKRKNSVSGDFFNC